MKNKFKIIEIHVILHNWYESLVHEEDYFESYDKNFTIKMQLIEKI